VLLLRRRARNIHREPVIAVGRMNGQLHLLKSRLRALLGGDILCRRLGAARDERGRCDGG
jgi:hypothetical protein